MVLLVVDVFNVDQKKYPIFISLIIEFEILPLLIVASMGPIIVLMPAEIPNPEYT